MSRHLQLAPRLSPPEPSPEAPGEGDDESPAASRAREHAERWKAKLPAVFALQRVIDLPEEARIYELDVRALCPFCGSGDATAATPCCSGAVNFSGGEIGAVEAPSAEAAMYAELEVPRLADPPDPAPSRSRLFEAAHLLVVLLAASMVGALASVATQRHLANVSLQDAQVARAILTELRSLPKATEAEPIARPEPAVASAHTAEAPPAEAAAPAPELPAAPAVPESPPAALPVPVAVAAQASVPVSVVQQPAPAAEEPLAPTIAPPPAPVQVAAVAPLAVIEKWSTLRRGMSRTAVRALLGDPKWVDHSRNIDFWLYEEDSIFGKGWVAFYDVEGPVSTWREP